MNPKQFYTNYYADDKISPLSHKLIDEILKFFPVHALDFGCGSGKHCNMLQSAKVSTIALDISMVNVIRANAKYDLPCVICTDETYLRNIANVDVVFTCSVLDHIKDVEGIVSEFKRIANKGVVLAETLYDSVSEFYYPHDYESMGFERLRWEWKSKENDGDGHTYHIWIWKREDTLNVPFLNDDLGV